VPKDELDREIGNAFNRMRELNQKLNEPVEKLDQEALDAQAEMIDELMTLDFGLQPFRRAMSQRAKEDKEGKRPEEPSSQHRTIRPNNSFLDVFPDAYLKNLGVSISDRIAAVLKFVAGDAII
jgi:hypothetical protein